MKWENKDWCFYEYKLAQIVVSKGKVTEASDGSFRTSGRDLSDCCRPLTLRNASITSTTAWWSDRLHREGHAGLNYPDIHRKMVDLWLAACDSADGKEQEDAVSAIGDFANKVLNAVRDIGEVDGVPLLRQRCA